jgi:NADH dehydrogenase [ubiquinone] 1 alpha subcomplex assembly factor 8
MTPKAPVTPATKPLQRFALHTTTTCASQASAYGKCILGTYMNVEKDACKESFEQFAACLRSAVRFPVFVLLFYSHLAMFTDEA